MGLAVFAQKTRRSADRQYRKTLFLYVPLTASATHRLSGVGALISTGFRGDDEITQYSRRRTAAAGWIVTKNQLMEHFIHRPHDPNDDIHFEDGSWSRV